MFLRSIACSTDLNIPDNITMAEDLLQTTQMFLKCENVVICPGVYYHYFCCNPSSATSNFSAKAFADSRTALEILIEKLSETYPDLADVCRGQILFSALRVPDVSANDYRNMFDYKTRYRVVCNRYQSFVKRVIIAISLVSIPLAKFACRILVYAARQLRAGK